MSEAPRPDTLEADYFDGRSARAHRVRLHLRGNLLHITGDGIARQLPARQVQWPERTRHSARVAHLPDGGALHGDDAAAWDAWLQAHGRTDSWIVRAQQSWHWVLASAALLVGLFGSAWQWGVPALGSTLAAAMPPGIEKAIGMAALQAVDEEWMRPSTLPAAQQERLRATLASALQAQPPGMVPEHALLFRRSRIGPNAFALPGGSLVMTDQLVTLVHGDEAMLTGVLAHELGHVRHRHGLRLLVQAALIGALSSAVLGDFSSLLSGVPVLLGQAGYSRDAEREADAYAVEVLKAAGISPAVMVRFFEKIAERSGQRDSEGGLAGLRIAIASHPADAERIRFFRDAARP